MGNVAMLPGIAGEARFAPARAGNVATLPGIAREARLAPARAGTWGTSQRCPGSRVKHGWRRRARGHGNVATLPGIAREARLDLNLLRFEVRDAHEVDDRVSDVVGNPAPA